ncbi:hypothetical protein ACVNF4_05830 [Streptomyces sp. S6]
MRPHQPRTIDEVLERARVRDGDGDGAVAHREASRRRITAQLHELHWPQTPSASPSPPSNRGRVALHQQAGADLNALCRGVLRDDDAVERIACFDTARDPGGALAFACVLFLGGREDGAQFWLQYAAGGGQATGAVCLYLLHLHRGEWYDATHWARQITVLQEEPCQYTPVAHEVVDTRTGTSALPPGPGGVTVYLDLPDDVTAVPEEAVRDAVGDLDVYRIDGVPALQSHPSLAHRLEELII